MSALADIIQAVALHNDLLMLYLRDLEIKLLSDLDLAAIQAGSQLALLDVHAEAGGGGSDAEVSAEAVVPLALVNNLEHLHLEFIVSTRAITYTFGGLSGLPGGMRSPVDVLEA